MEAMPTLDKLLPPIVIAAVVTVPLKVGLALNTKLPDPVEVVATAANKLALVGAASHVATPVPKPLIPVETGNPVALVKVSVLGTPKFGVTSTGEVENTNELVPVEVVATALNKFALVGAASHAATPAPNPVRPVDTGNPVALVNVIALGTPQFGVTSTGLFEKTTLLVPVFVVRQENRFALEGVPKKVAIPAPSPETPVEIGKFVQLTNDPALGTPISGVTKSGLEAKTNAPTPVASVTAASRLALVGVSKKFETPAPMPVTPPIGKPLQLTRLPPVGTPMFALLS